MRFFKGIAYLQLGFEQSCPSKVCSVHTGHISFHVVAPIDSEDGTPREIGGKGGTEKISALWRFARSSRTFWGNSAGSDAGPHASV